MKLRDIYMVENRILMLLGGSWDLKQDILNGGKWEEVLPPLQATLTVTASFDQFVATIEADSPSQTFTLSGTNCFASVIITPPEGYMVSLDGTTWAYSLSITPTIGVLAATTVYVKLLINVGGDYDGFITIVTVGASENLAVDGFIDVAYPIKYGFLYNWWVAEDASSKLIPAAMASEGWAVPSRTDRDNLNTYITSILGSLSAEGVGGALKQTGLLYWKTPNTGATNELLFNAKGGGQRRASDGAFFVFNESGYIWTKTKATLNPSIARIMTLNYNSDTFSLSFLNDLETGNFIRLFRAATAPEQLLDDGILSSTYYTGNDGKVYRVTKIGTQVWLADNLAETKYNDDSWIAGYDSGTYTPISDANWAALTTAALCAYDNDENNV
jgi:uncharacterized protein (TIGR02145 family)